MSLPCLWAIALLYSFAAADLFVQKQWGSALMITGASISTIGLIIAIVR